MNPTASNKLFNILQWPHEVPGIIALNTLRGCAHDDDPYSEVNLCDYTADDLIHVEACRNALCAALSISRDRLVMPRQTHTCNVAVVDDALMALPHSERLERLQAVDALVTRLGGVCIGVNTADCVNISLADAEAGVLGVAHAGWRGTVVIGPGISLDAFEVGDEVLDQFVAQGFSAEAISRRNAATGKAHIHLQEANRLVLLKAGLKPENITWNGECSRCHPHKYFSARRLGINSGRTFTGILTNPT